MKKSRYSEAQIVQINWDAAEHVDSAPKSVRRCRRKVSLRNQCFMVLLGRMELPTSSLPMTRSTTELQQPIKLRALEHMPY